MDLKSVLFELCAAHGPAGYERAAKAKAAEFLKPYTDEVYEDRFGNLVGLKRAKNRELNPPKIVLDAHLDTVGLIITGEEEGFLRFTPVGGLDTRILPAQEIVILTEPELRGIVTCLPPHVLTGEQKPFPPDELFIDAGLAPDKAKGLTGTFAVLHAPPVELKDGSIASGGLDDRAGFAAILCAMDMINNADINADIYVLGSVQEEVGTRGAAPGAFDIDPDVFIAVEVTFAYTPDSPKSKTVAYKGGVAIGVGPNMTRSLSDRLTAIAADKGIKHQFEVMEANTGTNAWPVQVVRGGVDTAVLSVPLKHMHTAAEVVHIDGIRAAAELIAEYLKSLGGNGHA